MVQRCSTDRRTEREWAQKAGVKVGQLLILAPHSMGTNPLSSGAESKPILPTCGLNQFLAAQQMEICEIVGGGTVYWPVSQWRPLIICTPAGFLAMTKEAKKGWRVGGH